MSSIKRLPALIVGCALGLALVTSTFADNKKDGDDGHGKSQKELRLLTLDGVATNIDVGATGNSAGDVAVFVRPLFNENGTQEVGTGAGRCTIIRVGAPPDWLAECAITHELKNGSITVQGLVRPRVAEPSVLAIVGGTGIYRKVRGELIDTPVIGTSGRPEAFELVFKLDQ